MRTEQEFKALIASIERQDLRECVEDTALVNANDTCYVERAVAAADFWEVACSTAEMALDNARGFYPELFEGRDDLTFYWGRREAVDAEVTVIGSPEARYVVQPTGENDWDAVECDSAREAERAAVMMADFYRRNGHRVSIIRV